jgi:soluble lytic murein transglycosylase-like protein
MSRPVLILLALLCLGPLALDARAGAQLYEPLSASVKARMTKVVSDVAPERINYGNPTQVREWLREMDRRLTKKLADPEVRQDFLHALHYEATRAGLDPEMVLGLIEVESNFRKYAVSTASARGLMQVMPFWVDLIGAKDHNLFHLRTNLRYGCTILRHYLDIERGDLFRALGRYNGSLGQAQYPNLVLGAWKRNWVHQVPRAEDEARPGARLDG